jgi:hypothetical protein
MLAGLVHRAFKPDDRVVHRRIGDTEIPLGGLIQGTTRVRNHEQQSVNVRPQGRQGTTNLLWARRMTQQQHLATRPPATAGLDLNLGPAGDPSIQADVQEQLNAVAALHAAIVTYLEIF